MRHTPESRAARREAFRQLSPAKKAEHIYTYYKVHILLAIAAAIILGSTIHRLATQKDTVLYTGLVNVSVGSQLESRLNEGYLDACGLDAGHSQVFFYRDLYLSDDPSAENHEFAYASRMKILATINARELDLVMMNREAYDLISASGYLLDLSGLFDGDARFQPHLTANTVVLEDNSIDYNLGNTDAYVAVTEEAVNAVDVSGFPLFRQAGFDDAVYIGIIGNTPRLPDCTAYLEYLLSA